MEKKKGDEKGVNVSSITKYAKQKKGERGVDLNFIFIFFVV